MLKTITPNYQVNLAWTTIKLRSSITFRLKPEVPYLEKSGVVYSFQCYCPAIYVGETKRKLESRIRDHNQGSRATAVYTHIKTCEAFYNKFSETYGMSPTFEIKGKNSKIESARRFCLLKDQFSIIQSNLDNYYRRTDFEGLYITVNKPCLNDQVKHKNIKII